MFLFIRTGMTGTTANLTHWGRVTHICVSEIIIIGSDNSLSPGRRQAIIWANDGILLIGPLRTNFSEIWIQINTFSFTKMHLKMSSGICWPYCLGLNVLNVFSKTSRCLSGKVPHSRVLFAHDHFTPWCFKVPSGEIQYNIISPHFIAVLN